MCDVTFKTTNQRHKHLIKDTQDKCFQKYRLDVNVRSRSRREAQVDRGKAPGTSTTKLMVCGREIECRRFSNPAVNYTTQPTSADIQVLLQLQPPLFPRGLSFIKTNRFLLAGI